jgi:hypothetical protein
MTRIGAGLAAIAAAVLMLGATPASACGDEAKPHACGCNKGASQAKAESTAPQDAKATTAKTAEKSEKAAPPAPAKASAPAPETQSCVLHPEGDQLAGKCSCGGPADCTCKKNDCQCGKCSKRHAGDGAQGV